MRDLSRDHQWLSINTATVRKQWPLDRIIEECARRGIRAISLWRAQVACVGIEKIGKLLRSHEVELSGCCRGGFYPAPDKAGLTAAVRDNRKAIDEAQRLNPPCLVLFVSSLPGALNGKAACHEIQRARDEVFDGVAASLEYARDVGMPLAIEPLRPMQAADRACINTLDHALDICEALDLQRKGKTQSFTAALGVVLDVYHVWWDSKLQYQIHRAGKEQLMAYCVSHWLTFARDLLNDRGRMGDGIIELRKIRGWVEADGYNRYCEVKIFSELDWWQRPGEDVLQTFVDRHKTHV